MNIHLLRAMQRRAGAMTLLVYATHTLAAALLGAPLGADFVDALARNFYHAQLTPDDGALLLELGARRLPTMVTWSVSCALAYAALAPLLSVAWSRAMHDSASVGASLRRGLRRYPAALALGASALLTSAALLGAAAAALSFALSHAALSATGEDAARAACVLLAAGAILVVSCARDLANVALATSALSAKQALLLSLRVVSPRTIAARALSALVIAACFACAELVGRRAQFALPPTAVLALQQALVFGATRMRGAWLALALDTVNARLRNEAPPRSAGAVPPTATQAPAETRPPLS